MPLVMEVGLSPGDFVLDGDPASPPLKGHSPPQFSVNIRCGETTGWTNVALGMEVGLGLGDFVFDGTQLRPEQWHTHYHPVFGPRLLWPNGWMDEDATWYGSRPRLRPHCIRRGSSAARNGHSSPPHLFGPCLLWPRSPISATAELLYKRSPKMVSVRVRVPRTIHE